MLALAVRGAVIEHAPVNYAFDALQRWGARDRVLVQVWLPGTQALITLVSGLGGDSAAARWVLAAVAAASVGAAVAWAGRVAGPVAAWAAVVVGLYGPFVTWSAALYQEGSFLLCLLGGLAAAAAGRLLLGDLLVGLAALVRFEAWPCLALWLVWRRDARALRAALPFLVWELLRRALPVLPHAASPVDYDDRIALVERFSAAGWIASARELAVGAWDAGAVAWLTAGAWGLWSGWRRPGVRLVAGWLVVQLAATAAWMVGLETSTGRMLVIPGVLIGCLGALGMADAWQRWPGMRPPLVAALFALGAYGVVDGWRAAGREQERLEPEARVAESMEQSCPDCTWWVEPREGLGTRDRHDGCEILQGITDLRHGEGFWCGAWVPAEERDARRKATGGEVRWTGVTYVVMLRSPG